MTKNSTLTPADDSKAKKLVIFMTVFLYLVGFGIIIPILPLLARDFGASSVGVGLLMSVYSLMQFIFSPFWGRLSDRFGRRPILLFCLAGEGLSYILFALARNFELLFLARAFAGFFGASISTASAYISDITPPNERSKGMALIGAAFGLGFMVGPALGGGLTIWGTHISQEPHFGTSFTALWVSALCLGNFALGLKVLKESLPHEKRHLTVDKSSRLKLIFKHLTRPLMGQLIGVFFLSSLAMSSMEATLVLLTGDKFGWTIKEVSFGFAYIGVIMVLTQGFLIRRLLPIFGERKMMSIGLILFGSGLLGISISPTIGILAIAMTALALGNGFTNPSTLGSISLLANPSEQGVVLGVTQSLSSLGRIIGPLLGGALYAYLHEGPFVASAFMAAVALLIVVMNFQKIPNLGRKTAS